MAEGVAVAVLGVVVGRVSSSGSISRSGNGKHRSVWLDQQPLPSWPGNTPRLVGLSQGRIDSPSPDAVSRRGSVQTTLPCAVRSVRPSAPCVRASTRDVLDDSSAGVLSA